MAMHLKAVRRPPGPDEPIALEGNAETLTSLQRLQAAYGNIVAVSTPKGRSAYFVNDPDAIRSILVRNHSKYVKGPGFERVKILLGNGLFVSDGSVWRRSRTMVQVGFTRQNLDRLISLIVRCCRQRALRWQEIAAAGESISITKEMTDFALEVILRAVFGKDYDHKVVTDGENPFAFLSEDSSRDLKLALKLRALRELVLRIIDERRSDAPADDYDFLSVYLSAKDKAGKTYTDNELLDELMTLIVAGFETSAGTLNWAWYLLAAHPEVDRKVCQEARQHIPGADAVNNESLAELTYLRNVLDETMRLYPPGWLFSRRAITDNDIGDYDVPAGTDIYICPYILHRSEEFWNEPQRFDPDRFVRPDAEDDASQRQSAFIPFSLGPRRCIGEYFAILEMKIHLGLLSQQFRMIPLNDSRPDLELGINLRARQDILLRPVPRPL